MNLQPYLNPVDLPSDDPLTLGAHLQAYRPGSAVPETPTGSVVLLGATLGATPEASPANAIRERLYALAPTTEQTHLVDLGNLVPGHSAQDTAYALAEIVATLVDDGCTVVLLADSHALAHAAYGAYERLGRIVNIANIDSRFDIDSTPEVAASSWLYHIILTQPNYLFNYTNLGHQTYLTGAARQSLMEQLQFDTIRLGQMQEQGMAHAEPYIRWSDMLSVDMGAVRQSDAPGANRPSPHGLYGEELCQLLMHAGMSEKLSCLGLYEYDPRHDRDGQTAHLMAQALWHFLEGYAGRVGEMPWRDRTGYRHFVVPLAEGHTDIHFYKSRRTDRWWFEVPAPSESSERYSRHLLIPCSYADYQQALQNELPDRWWTIYNRVNQQ